MYIFKFMLHIALWKADSQMLLSSKSTCTKFNDTPYRPAKTKPIED